VPTASLEPGTTVKVMTGAPVPDGASRVIKIEDTSLSGDVVHVHDHRDATNVCVWGEDMRTGDPVMSAGTLLTPLEIGILVACGLTEMEVSRLPRVSLLATGGEIVDSPAELAPGKIMNANGPLLATLCGSRGWPVVHNSIVPDEPAATREALRTAVAESDLVILSGGVSVGDFDFVGSTLVELGFEVHFTRVAVKPGRPVTFATAGDTLLFGLPGNPVSLYLTFHLFLLRAARLLMGAPAAAPCLALPLAADYRRGRANRAACVPCSLSEAGHPLPQPHHGSADLPALVGSRGYFLLPAGVSHVPAGEIVEFFLTRSSHP
jgi:molybdopterin molybdotransferase